MAHFKSAQRRKAQQRRPELSIFHYLFIIAIDISGATYSLSQIDDEFLGSCSDAGIDQSRNGEIHVEAKGPSDRTSLEETLQVTYHQRKHARAFSSSVLGTYVPGMKRPRFRHSILATTPG